ncbi:zinc ribbon domain-containing protein [Enterococcus sp. BWR-S5]|uniref:zinc ribbon domain-containing protein n=1 Tax=Enterococcus sp. BWR-S5 TaxID=2787714 RepID=UPI001923FB57|nr:zinc ribbon domain-containing protein [Enterococcus sp. BWR-S5]MBL1224663.1 zinc ribbon domain-containing protein [Enterococcus sp. BWR-S5]
MVICQSCGMDIEMDKDKGTNTDGTLSSEYCLYCFKEGSFTNNLTIDQYVEIGLDYSPEYKAATSEKEKVQIKEQAKAYLATLKRWKKAN